MSFDRKLPLNRCIFQSGWLKSREIVYAGRSYRGILPLVFPTVLPLERVPRMSHTTATSTAQSLNNATH